MKKEWIYFVAGAGLMAAVVFFSMPDYANYEECIIREAAKLKSLAHDFFSEMERYCESF